MFRQIIRRAVPSVRAMVSLEKIKALRDITGSPISQCKAALDEVKEDVQKAKELLEARGLAHPKPKARRYKDGYISLSESEKGVQLVQLSCETDFVARTKDFQDTLKALMRTLEIYPKAAVDNTELESFLQAKLEGEIAEKYANKTVKAMLGLMSSSTMENCEVNNLLKRPIQPGNVIGTYLHGEITTSSAEPRIGTRAGIVVFESGSTNLAEIKKLANSIAMQVAAMRPLYKDKESLPADVLKEKGKDQSFLEEMVLMEQEFIDGDDKKTVREVIIQKQYELKALLNIKEFFSFDCKQ